MPRYQDAREESEGHANTTADTKKHDVKQSAEDKFKADEKLRAEEHKDHLARIEAAQKYADAKKKEDERLAKMKPDERAAEDKRRAAMTADERAKEDESKGLVKPEGFDQVNPLVAGPPSFAPLTETPHSAEFILSEGNGYVSRDNCTIAAGDSVKVGQTVKITTAATLTAPAVVTGNVTTDTASDGIAIYAVPVTGAAAQVAVLTRNAEVNANLLYYPGTILAADKLAIVKALAVHGIMVR
jgi:biotin carboxyl carrier protein